MTDHFTPPMRRVYQLAVALTALSVIVFAVAFVLKHTQPGSDRTDLLWLAVGLYILAVALGGFLPYPPPARITATPDRGGTRAAQAGNARRERWPLHHAPHAQEA